MLPSKQLFNVVVAYVNQRYQHLQTTNNCGGVVVDVVNVADVVRVEGGTPPLAGLGYFNAPKLQTAQKLLVINKCHPP